VDDFGVKIDLSDFFSSVSTEKKKKQEEFNSIVGELNLNSIFEEVTTLKKKTKIKKKKEEKTLEAFENWLYSNKVKEQPIEEVQEIVEEVIGEVQEIVDNIAEEISEEPKKESTLIEKSLGLLSEPSNTKVQNDPLTPLDQKFATLDDLQKHYNLFITRIQQQLSTLGGSGEVRLEFLDDVDRDSAKVNKKFLKYNSSTGKWEGSNAGGGGPAYYAATYITSSSYTITENDYYIGVNYAGAVTITLPTGAVEGTTYIVKDELGQASKGTNRYITILPSGSDKIDGRNRAILAYDFGSLTFFYRDGWRVV
jgi:DNA-directed RNA polymerase subunit F